MRRRGKYATLAPIRFKHIMGFLIVSVTVFGHLLLFFQAIPKVNVATIHHSMGILDSASMLILSYYFGSSSGSKEKSKMLNEHLKDTVEEGA